MLIRNINELPRAIYYFGIPVFRVTEKDIVKFSVVS